MATSSTVPKDHPTLIYEHQLGYPSLRIAGADEVGRGCLAGPVVAAAVVLPAQICFESDPWLLEIDDSKKLTAETRERLGPLIRSWALAFAIGFATVSEIDEINIFHASHLAIVRAIQGVSKVLPHHVLIDGKFLPRKGLQIPATAVIKGDQKCLSIAAASILAKVWRDEHMVQLDQEFPGYGLAKHKGYPTPAHKFALKSRGVTQIHRRTFTTVAQAINPTEASVPT